MLVPGGVVEDKNLFEMRLQDVDKGFVVGMGDVDLQTGFVLEGHEKCVGEIVVQSLDALGESPLNVDDGVDLLFEEHELIHNPRDVVVGGGVFELKKDGVAERSFLRADGSAEDGK